MRNYAPLADANSKRSMLDFSAETCFATFWFSNGLAAGISLNLEEVKDPFCHARTETNGYFKPHTSCTARPNTVCVHGVQAQRHNPKKPYKMEE